MVVYILCPTDSGGHTHNLDLLEPVHHITSHNMTQILC